MLTLNRRRTAIEELLLASLTALCLLAVGQAQVLAPTPSTSCTDHGIIPGVVVEAVAKSSEAEKVGLAEGDLVLTWTRGDAKGEIESPFYLLEVEIEQEPRGPVTLEGTRSTTKQMWVIGPDGWGIQARPILPEGILEIYLEGQKLAKAGKLADAAEQWRAAATEGQKYECSWLNAWFLLHAAEKFAEARQWKESDALYEGAVEKAAGAGPGVTATLLRRWARTFWQRRDWSSVEKYEGQALAEEQKMGGETLSTAFILSDLGIASYRLGGLDKAQELQQRALAIRERWAPGSLDVGASLGELGNVAWDRGDLTKADEYFQRSLAIYEKLAPGSRRVAVSLNNLGNVADDRGDLTKTEEYYSQALAILEKLVPDSMDVRGVLNNLGVVAYDHGDLARAEDYYRKALAIIQKLAPGSLDLAVEFNNLGVVASWRGDQVKAEEYYRESLAIRSRLAPGSLDVASSFDNLGNLARDRGDLGTAKKYYLQSLAIYEKQAPDSLKVASVLNNLGGLARRQGDLATAEEHFEQSWAISEKHAPTGPDAARVLRNLGYVANDRGDSVKAAEYYNQALAIHRKLAPGSLDIAITLSDLAEIMRKRGNLTDSEEYYRQALEIRKTLAPASAEHADSLAALAEIMRDKQQPAAALQLYAQAIDVLENQLTRLGGSSETRADYRAKHRDYYSEYANLLLTQKQPEIAFQVLERSRARTLAEMLSEVRVDIRRGADSSLLERERTLQTTLVAKSSRRVDLLEKKHSDEQVAAFDREIDELLGEYREVEGQIRNASPTYAALTQPQALGTREIQQQLLDADTLLLEFALGEGKSYVFALSSTSLAVFELPKRIEIEALAHQTYDFLTERNRWAKGETNFQRNTRLSKADKEYQKNAAALSQMILGPVAGQLEGKRLLIVSDGALQFVPFASLPLPTNADRSPKSKDETPFAPLVLNHEVVNLPSASVLAELRRQANGHESESRRAVAILADPVFDKDDPRVAKSGNAAVPKPEPGTDVPSVTDSSDDRLTRSLGDIGLQTDRGSGLPRLVFTRQEAASILAAAPKGEGMEALDFDASRATAVSPKLAAYRIVHIATHALLDNEHPELSGLVLSMVDRDGKPQNGFLDLEDVYNLNLPVDLVVLSACETGLGKEVNGEGLIGLTRGFMYAGAPRVVASLWRVDDVATAKLMGHFYDAMLRQGLRPAAALRDAQIEMSKEKRWRDPYYWAAFTIQGEWR